MGQPRIYFRFRFLKNKLSFWSVHRAAAEFGKTRRLRKALFFVSSLSNGAASRHTRGWEFRGEKKVSPPFESPNPISLGRALQRPWGKSCKTVVWTAEKAHLQNDHWERRLQESFLLLVTFLYSISLCAIDRNKTIVSFRTKDDSQSADVTTSWPGQSRLTTRYFMATIDCLYKRTLQQ